MKKLMQITYAVATLLALTLPAVAGTYTIRGDRYLRKYTAPNATQVYNAETDAQRVANSLCDVAWEKSSVGDAMSTTHTSTNLDWNVANREYFDAALFCANHVGNTHVAYANAACYCYELPTGALPRLTALSATVWSDPYNVYGARISIYTSDSPTIPTDCATVRGDADGGIKLAGIAPRITRHNETENKDYWYPATSNATFTADQLGASGVQLKRYLFVFVLMENYATSRGNWLEGSSYIDNSITITTSADIPGWSYGCDVCEPYATNYNLKNGHAGDDDDGDGLSNYAEYLITEVFHWGSLSISNECSNGVYPDAYQRRGQLYFKEIFAAMNGKKVCTPSAPVNITANISYYGIQDVTAPIYLRCWNEDRDSDMVTHPDAVWKISSTHINGTHAFTAEPDQDKWLGYDFSGDCKFEVWADVDGNGKYTVGEPFCFAKHIAIGKQGGEINAELTDTSRVFARIDLDSKDLSRCADCQIYGGNNAIMDVSDGKHNTILTNLGVAYLGQDFAAIQSIESNRILRIRVARALVDGSTILGKTTSNEDVEFNHRVIIDKRFNLDVRSYIHEGDFLDDDNHDADWQYLFADVCAQKIWYFDPEEGDYRKRAIYPTTVSYMIEIGDNFHDPTGCTVGSNTVFNCFVTKNFEGYFVRHATTYTTPVLCETDCSMIYGGNPTFSWEVNDYGSTNLNSYTTCIIKIYDSNNSNVWTSGYQPVTARADGRCVWTMTDPIGSALTGDGNYTWRVLLLNAEQKLGDVWNGYTVSYWSTNRVLVVNQNNQQPMNDHGYSSINVAVRYAGPTSALTRVAYTNGAVVVEASHFPDFVGDAVGGFTSQSGASVIGNPSNTNTFERICGLPQNGTYYIRAFIDLNGNGVKDDFEPFGTYGDPIVLSDKLMTPPEIAVYIEDVDTDDDLIPDAYEYAAANFTGDWNSVKTRLNASIIGGDTILFSETVGTASISRGMQNAYLSTLQNDQSFMRTLLNLGTTTKSIEAIRVEAEGNQ